MNLFQMNHQQRELLSVIENGELSPEDAADTLDAMDYDFDKKVEDICHVLRDLTSREQSIKNEMERLTSLKSSVSNNIIRLKEYALQGMISSGKTSIKSDLFNVSLRKGRQVVDVKCHESIPDEYVRITPATESPDKAKILKALKSGEKVDGCAITTGKQSLNIK